MSEPVAYPVGEVARLSGVTVRTLHHYDEIGLLRPGHRSRSGYRRYRDDDLRRLQQILVYRELGFPLDEIATILADPRVDPIDHLRRQHALLVRRLERLRAMVDALEHMMEAQQMGINLTPRERFEVFGDVDLDQYAAEAEQRWGRSDAYRESQRRAASYGKDDWLRLKEEQERLYQQIGDAMDGGAPPDSARAMDLAEQHRGQISRWFYDCSYEIHRGLAEMYVADHRFTETLDRQRAGLAAYLREAILANATRAG
jgi:MerR family transcriptional regulator, thiopeptide resistance regulator